jgi:hypothetical protein
MLVTAEIVLLGTTLNERHLTGYVHEIKENADFVKHWLCFTKTSYADMCVGART